MEVSQPSCRCLVCRAGLQWSQLAGYCLSDGGGDSGEEEAEDSGTEVWEVIGMVMTGALVTGATLLATYGLIKYKIIRYFKKY